MQNQRSSFLELFETKGDKISNQGERSSRPHQSALVERERTIETHGATQSNGSLTSSYQVYFDNELATQHSESSVVNFSFNNNSNNQSRGGRGSTGNYHFNKRKQITSRLAQPPADSTSTPNLHNRNLTAMKMSKYALGDSDALREIDIEQSSEARSSLAPNNDVDGDDDDNDATSDNSSSGSSRDSDDDAADDTADNYIIKCKIKNETYLEDEGKPSGMLSGSGSRKTRPSSEEAIAASASFLRNKDLKNILFLMFLYLLQGVPLGLTGSLPFIMSSRNVSYKDQGTFSFAFWPFSMKLLWAPIVDTLYIKRFGRRKSWLVPMQYLIGIFLILFSDYVHTLLEGPSVPTAHFDSSAGSSVTPATKIDVAASQTLSDAATSGDIYKLTLIFFMFTFMAATQDIAVDGWGLTILSKENTAWSSTCNSVGQTTGWFIGNVIFLVFESPDFCNKYVRSWLGLPFQTYGLITIDRFMQFFGIVFIVTTTLILLFKKENSMAADAELRKSPSKSDTSVVKYRKLDEEAYGPDEQPPEAQAIKMNVKKSRKQRKSGSSKKLKIDEDNLSLRETYKLLLKIFKLPAVIKFSFILVTYKIAFATHSMSYLKLIEKGVPKENLGLLAVPLTPFEIVLPILVTRYTNGPKPLHFFVKSLPFRLIMVLLITGFVYVTPMFKDASTNVYPFYYYLLCILINAMNSTTGLFTSLSTISFFTRISDKRIGGTYMTLLNTISNIGSSWPSTLSYFLVDLLTLKQCLYEPNQIISYSNASFGSANLTDTRNLRQRLDMIDANKCASTQESGECTKLGGFCSTVVDAYYLITFICVAIGVVWLLTYKRLVYRLQASPKSAWKIK